MAMSGIGDVVCRDADVRSPSDLFWHRAHHDSPLSKIYPPYTWQAIASHPSRHEIWQRTRRSSCNGVSSVVDVSCACPTRSSTQSPSLCPASPAPTPKLTQGISSKFAEDLCLSPSARGADVSHAVVAVGSRSVNKAADFIKQFCPNGGTAQVEGLCKVAPKAYGSYAEVVSDPVRKLHP